MNKKMLNNPKSTLNMKEQDLQSKDSVEHEAEEISKKEKKLVAFIEHKIENDSRVTNKYDTRIKFYFYEDINKHRRIEWEVTGRTLFFDNEELGKRELYRRVTLCDFYTEHIQPWIRGIDDPIIMKRYLVNNSEEEISNNKKTKNFFQRLFS